MTSPWPDDLALAQAASRGEADAIRALETTYAPAITAVCRRFASRGHGEDDLRQILRDKLLVGDAPALALYNGEGALGTWLRVIATRLFIDLGRRKDRTREALVDDGLADAIAPDDPTFALIKAEYRGAVAAALRAAVAELAPGDRHLLRQHLVGGLTIDQLAAVLGIHRATAARRIATAREQLAAATRTRLAEHLRLDARELAEVFALVVSQIDLSMRTLLASKR